MVHYSFLIVTNRFETAVIGMSQQGLYKNVSNAFFTFKVFTATVIAFPSSCLIIPLYTSPNSPLILKVLGKCIFTTT